MTQEPFFFRESKGALYGSYHPPTAAVRSTAVVLCQPFGHEYVQSHRAVRLVAERLAEVGFPTLRFDYRGTGDSAGDAAEMDLDAWREDVRAATEICRARSGRRKVCGLGLRLGGSLVALESARGGAFDSIVLWDPIADGTQYLDELTALERQFRLHLPGGTRTVDDAPDEVLGFPYAAKLRQQIGALAIDSSKAEGTRAALCIHTEHAGSKAPALDLGIERHDTATVDDPRIWMEDADKALIPQAAIKTIVDWLIEVYA